MQRNIGMPTTRMRTNADQPSKIEARSSPPAPDPGAARFKASECDTGAREDAVGETGILNLIDEGKDVLRNHAGGEAAWRPFQLAFFHHPGQSVRQSFAVIDARDVA